MSEQEQMDDLIRSKFSEERDFPFDEENWSKAEDMIVAARAKEKRRRWIVIFFSGIIIGALVMIPFVMQKGDNKQLTLKKENKQTPQDPNTMPANSNFEKTNTNEKMAEQTTTGNTNSNSQITDDETEKTNASVAQGSAAEEKIKNTADPKVISQPIGKEKTVATVVPETKTYQAAVSTKHDAVKEGLKKQKDTVGSTSSNFSNSQLKPDGQKAFKNAWGAKRQNKDNWRRSDKVQTVAASVKDPSNNKATDKTLSQTDAGKKNNSADVTVSKADKANPATENQSGNGSAVKDNSSAIVQPAVTNAANGSQKDTTAKITNAPTDSIEKTQTIATKKDSTPPVVAQPLKKDSAVKPKNAWTVSLDAGINTFLSGGSGISPFGGINFTKIFTPKWELGAGVYYTYLPTYSGASTFTTGTVYDFGYTFKLTEIVTDKLHYVTAPLFVKYNLNEKNSLVLGANFYYLFNSSNIVTTYDLSYTGIQQKVSKKASGYFNGFSVYDIGIMAGYRKDLFDKFGLGVYLNYGLMNLQKAGAGSSINIHNNISGQIMLTYKLFK